MNQKKFLSLLFCFGIFVLNAQVRVNDNVLQQIYEDQKIKSTLIKSQVEDYLTRHSIPKTIVLGDKIIELHHIDKSGKPQYLVTSNAVSAETISTDEIHPGGATGLNLDGEGILVHQWDAGSVRNTHQEFDNRITNGDSKPISWHSTHVCGTIVASGAESNAKGMAYAANLIAFDWDEFNEEMATEAAAGAIISNHSYGWLRGWEGNTWWGDPEISNQEDYHFGFYDYSAQLWDSIVFAAPYFLVIKSAGNDRNNCGDGTYPCDGPYDCIDQLGIAKNNLVVAAVNDIPGGYTQASDVVMSGFSSWGPVDDGRIKPDISANGVGLYSTNSGSDDDYRNASGTSMSTPSVSGSIALLQQHYQNLSEENNFMTAATAKALVIHTSDETGDAIGPDYEFGWGLMNTKNAALKISENDSVNVILEESLTEGETFSFAFTSTDTTTIKVTLVWTDPPGTPPEPSLDPEEIMLVNDLDLSVENTVTGEIYYPWKLDKNNPSNPATNDFKNNVDNVEKVFIPSSDSGTIYIVRASHDGSLQNGSQEFSLVSTFTSMTGPVFDVPETDFVANNTTLLISDTVSFTDLSTNSPKSWRWSISPNYITFVNGTDSTSQSPDIRFDSIGSYNVSLESSNELGSTTESKLDYITSYDILTLTTSAFPDEVCLDDSSELWVYAEGGTGNFSFSWTSNPVGFISFLQNPIVEPEITTTYFIEVSDGQQIGYDSIFVSVNPLPEIILINWPESLCNEDEPPVQLEASPSGGIFMGGQVTPEGLFTAEGAPTGWNVITYTYQDENGCNNSSADSIFIDDCVGITLAQFADNFIKIYPNPSSGIFYVESLREIKRIEIINQLGEVVRDISSSGKHLEINLNGASGLFFIRVTLATEIGLETLNKIIFIQ